MKASYVIEDDRVRGSIDLVEDEKTDETTLSIKVTMDTEHADRAIEQLVPLLIQYAPQLIANATPASTCSAPTLHAPGGRHTRRARARK